MTRSDLVSYHTSTHKVGQQYQERLGYWLRICHGILFTLNISVMGKRSLMVTKNKLDSHQSSTHGIVNYSFVSMGENPTVRLFFYLSFLYFADIFIQAHYSVRHVTFHFSDNNYKTAKILKKQKMRPSPC